MFFLRTRHKTSWIYRNKKYSFTLELPAGWDKGVFESSSDLSLFGPTNELVRMGIGPLSPTPDLQTRQDDLRRMATERGQTVLEVGTIHVLGEDHATMLVDIPTIGRRKNYSLVFDDIECLVSSNAEAADDILRSYKHYVDFKKLDRFYARHGLS